MSLPHSVWLRSLVLLVSVLFITVLFGFAMPQTASASAITLTTATTTSNNASTTLAKVGDTVTIGIQLSGTPWETPKINLFNLGTTSFTGGSGSFWQYATTAASVWTESALQFYFSYGGTTAGDATSTKSQADITGANVVFDKTVPTISTVTSNATAGGVLKVGDTIIFTLTPGATEYGGTVASSYNSQSLTWSTSNNGATFTATYTVAEGETDRTTALQASSVVLSDAASNASSAGAGSDIVKTIDANSPSTPTGSPAGGTSSVGAETITLTSSGSDSIRYTQDGTSPTCSTGTLYSSTFNINASQTIKVIGCDTAGNDSAVASLVYTITSSSGGGGGGGRRSTTPKGSDVPATTPAAAHASGLSSSQTESILSLLASFNAEPSVIAKVRASLMGPALGSPVPPGQFIRDLSLGSTGDDVMALQKFLNSHGFPVAASGPGSSGNETNMFGALTRAALAKFQASKGISPTAGYFGPKTRAAVAGM